jgi:hypothetical protein
MHQVYTSQLLRAFRQAPWRTQTQAVAAWSMILIIIAVLGGLYLSVAARAGTAGRDLQRWEAQKAELIRSNDELRAKLAELRSVTRMAERARQLGFVPAQPGEVEYVAVNNYPVDTQTAMTPEEPASTTAAAFMGDWLADALRGLVPGGGG